MGKPVTIVPYNPDWVDTCNRLRDFVAPTLSDLAVTIDHVGSTAVPGLAAKPIIDIDVVVVSTENVPAAVNRLESLGYHHEGDLGIPGRDAFRAPEGLPEHHLYVWAAASSELRRHRMFRDYLRSHPDEAKTYQELKVALADQFTHDRETYTESKSEFINSRLKRPGWNK